MADTLLTKLDTIKQIDFTALDYDSIQSELIDYVSVSQTSEGVNDQFLNGDASKMIIDSFSYLGNILAFRTDTLSNENFLSTANDLQSVIYQLEQVGIRPNNPKTSTVTLIAVPNTISSSDIEIPLRFSVPATGLNGNQVSFEIMNNPTDYFNTVTIPAGVSNFAVKAFSGSYRTSNVISTGQASQAFILTDFPVIDGSIKVSVSRNSSGTLTPEIIESTRITEVTNLADNVDEIIYAVSYNAFGLATLSFATTLFGIIPPKGFTIHVDYRVGGGSNTNVSVNTINVSTNFTNFNNEQIQIILSNPDSQGEGGKDADDVDTLKIKAPGLVRSNNNAVTVDDYETIIKQIGGVQDVFALDRYTDQSEFSGQFGVPKNTTFSWILPVTGGEVSPDLRQVIAGELASRRLTAINNMIFNPVYINWELVATIKLIPTAYAAREDELGNTLRQRIESKLLATFGRDIAKFQTSISYSKIISIIQSFTEVEDVVLSMPTSSLISQENEVLRLLPINMNLTFVK